MSEPMDRDARIAKRDRISEYHLAVARLHASRHARSAKCGDLDEHADTFGGCANDGSSCLCECHDPAVTP